MSQRTAGSLQSRVAARLGLQAGASKAAIFSALDAARRKPKPAPTAKPARTTLSDAELYNLAWPERPSAGPSLGDADMDALYAAAWGEA